jgi:integrase
MEVRDGTHSVPSRSVTVADAGGLWLGSCAVRRGTLAQYRQHCRLHINPRLGRLKLAKLTKPGVVQFRDALIAGGMSRMMVRKVLVSLTSIVGNAQERGLVAQNVARSVKVTIPQEERREVVIPRADEIADMLETAKGKLRTYTTIFVAAFAGLRASEIRGLRWCDVDLEKGALAVAQRADRYGGVGAPKSKAGTRTVPIGPMLVATLRRWKVQSAFSRPDDLVLTAHGTPIEHRWMLEQFHNVQRAAGIVDAAGKPKYGLHSLRHYYASMCINRVEDGGLGLPVKNVSKRLGHSSIVITLDTYGHLFPSDDTGDELAAAELRATRGR